MKNIKTLCLFLSLNLIIPVGFSKSSNGWYDVNQDSIQINLPVEFIDAYGKYSLISKDKKIRLTDFGDIEKNKSGKKYILKKYGVQILNNGEVYNIFKATTPFNSNVDFNILYHDKNVVAFRVRDNSTINYVKKPFRSFTVNTYIYNFSSNKFSQFPVLNSESELDGKQLDLLQGDQFTFNAKKGIYSYVANIKHASNGKIGIFKVDLNNSLKCISATLGCENVGLDFAEINK